MKRRFFPHDPGAELRKGVALLLVGGGIVAAVFVGLAVGGRDGAPPRILSMGVAGLVFGLCVALHGGFTIREGLALRREQALRRR